MFKLILTLAWLKLDFLTVQYLVLILILHKIVGIRYLRDLVVLLGRIGEGRRDGTMKTGEIRRILNLIDACRRGRVNTRRLIRVLLLDSRVTVSIIRFLISDIGLQLRGHWYLLLIVANVVLHRVIVIVVMPAT